MHKHVMWAVCDVSVVQPHLYFGLFGWGHATLKIVPKYGLTCILVCLVGGLQLLKLFLCMHT